MSDSTFKEWLPIASVRYQTIKEGGESSEFQALEALLQLDKELNNFQPLNAQLILQKNVLIALLNLEKGRLLRSSNERAEDYLKKGWAVLKKHWQNPNYVFLGVCLLAETSALLTQKNEFQAACMYADEIYKIFELFDFSKERCIVSFKNLFLNEDAREEKVLLNIRDQLNDMKLQIVPYYSYSIVKFWLQILENMVKNDGTYLQCIDNLVRLANTLILQKKFCLARHVLACASQLYIDSEEHLRTKVESDSTVFKELESIHADVSTSWGAYIVHLLDWSNEKGCNAQLVFFDLINDHLPAVLSSCGSLPENEVKKIKHSVPCTRVTNSEQVKEVLSIGERNLNLAISHNTNMSTSSDLSAINFVMLARYLHKLRLYSIALEPGIHKKCKFYKCSLTILQRALGKLDVPQLPLEIYKELLFDCGDCSYQLAFLKSRKIDCPKVKDPEMRKVKINSFAIESIQYFKLFLSSFKTEGVLPPTFPTGDVEHVLICYTNLADAYLLLYGDEIENAKKADNICATVLGYFRQNPVHSKLMAENFPIIKTSLVNVMRKVQEIRK